MQETWPAALLVRLIMSLQVGTSFRNFITSDPRVLTVKPEAAMFLAHDAWWE